MNIVGAIVLAALSLIWAGAVLLLAWLLLEDDDGGNPYP